MRHLFFATAVLAAVFSAAATENPFHINPTLQLTDGHVELNVQFDIPPRHLLYKDQMSVTVQEPDGVTLFNALIPPSKHKWDDLLGKEIEYYDAPVTWSYTISDSQARNLVIQVAWQGCDETTCFLPQREKYSVGLDTDPVSNLGKDIPQSKGIPSPEPRLAELADEFDFLGSGTGYMNPDAFRNFLMDTWNGREESPDLVRKVFDRYGLFLSLLIVIPLGLLLNLTPCVLPMIPINLAIIGAGTRSGSKGKGFLLGGLYGLGMALVYGILGILVVLTGATFGALNASPWFNIGICIVFLVLALAMFDVIVVDFSRFQRGGPTDGRNGRAQYVTAFVLGGMAALLAGACVAPVLISVLLLATDLYTKGNVLGLLLPFMLGVGMALPWPLAGGGLSVMPRPGNWMNHIKHGFGVLIILFAVYYGHLGVQLLHSRATADQPVETLLGWTPSLEEGLRLAAREGKPVFLDFWALSCKSCMKMKKTTFRDPAVAEALADYVKIELQTDNPEDATIAWALDRYGVLGLPTYVVLRPRMTDEGRKVPNSSR